MKAIDELRNEICILRNHYNIDTCELVRIADAIERELEEEYVALPKDVNGDVWRVDDLIVGELNPNNPKRVERMLWYGPDAEWQLETDSIIYTCPERSRHYHALTVEDVLEKALNEAAMLDRIEGYWPSAADITNIVNELAPKLQLREED